MAQYGLLAVLAAAAFWFASAPENAAASPEENWLLKLAEVGRSGTAILCNPAALERKLELPVDRERHKASNPFARAGHFVSPDSALVGHYTRAGHGGAQVCRLRLKFLNAPICGTQSPRMQRMLAARLQTGLAMIAEAGHYDHGYEFAHPPPERVLMGWRTSTAGCASDVELVGTTG